MENKRQDVLFFKYLLEREKESKLRPETSNRDDLLAQIFIEIISQQSYKSQ